MSLRDDFRALHLFAALLRVALGVVALVHLAHARTAIPTRPSISQPSSTGSTNAMAAPSFGIDGDLPMAAALDAGQKVVANGFD